MYDVNILFYIDFDVTVIFFAMLNYTLDQKILKSGTIN
jgi:hypothetical protein